MMTASTTPANASQLDYSLHTGMDKRLWSFLGSNKQHNTGKGKAKKKIEGQIIIKEAPERAIKSLEGRKDRNSKRVRDDAEIRLP